MVFSALEQDPEGAFRNLQVFVEGRKPLGVLTGAGCSTESGIPDYRDRQGAWKRKMPVKFGEFVKSEIVQRRYRYPYFLHQLNLPERAIKKHLARSLSAAQNLTFLRVCLRCLSLHMRYPMAIDIAAHLSEAREDSSEGQDDICGK